MQAHFASALQMQSVHKYIRKGKSEMKKIIETIAMSISFA